MKNKLTFTDSTLWFLPMFNLPRKTYKEAGFINAFIGDEQHFSECIRPLYLLFKVGYEEQLEDIVTMLDSAVISQYNYNNLHVVVLKIPQMFYRDCKLIEQGRYSELSDDYRALVSEKVQVTQQFLVNKKLKRLQLQIIDKDPLPQQWIEEIYDIQVDETCEYWTMFDKQKETITKQLIEQLS